VIKQTRSKNLKLNHISDRESMCICEVYACLCVFACMYIYCMQKLFQISQFNLKMLASSN